MSRSYKKNPWVTDHKRKSSKISKRLANQQFRRKISLEEDMAARPKHKKYTESWSICDYKDRMSRLEAIYHYENMERVQAAYPTIHFKFFKRFPTLDKWLAHWEKWYRRK